MSGYPPTLKALELLRSDVGRHEHLAKKHRAQADCLRHGISTEGKEGRDGIVAWWSETMRHAGTDRDYYGTGAVLANLVREFGGELLLVAIAREEHRALEQAAHAGAAQRTLNTWVSPEPAKDAPAE